MPTLAHVLTAARSRVGRLRERVIDAPEMVCIERARYLTRAMKAHWDEHPLERMSKAFSEILDNISVIIREGEVIVGCRTSKLKGAPLFPENKCRWIEGDLDTMNERILQRALITEAEIAELREEILPFWRGRTVEERLEEILPPDVEEDMDKYVFTMMLEITYGIGHFTMDHGRVLAMGLSGVIEEALERLAALGDGERSGEKGLFYEAVVRSCEAVARFANRYAEEAERQAAIVEDPVRAAELLEVARVCRKVPESPAETFHEALQAMYLIHLVAQIESGGNSISLGRIDQVLFPYYEADVKVGRVTPERARELTSLMFLKTCEIWNVLEEAFIPGGEGPEGKTTQNVIVGGLGPDGEDATNELSYIGLDAFADISTVQPNFGVRLGSRAPRELLAKTAGYARAGVPLHFFNDEAIIPSLVEAGVTLQDARDYGCVGCVEPNAQGKTFGSTFAVQFNGIKCVELALSNGIDNTFGYQSGPQTGDPAGFGTFENAWNAYTAQVGHFLKQVERGMMCLDRAIAESVPSPFASCMVDGPLEKGLDLTRGGAVYNSTGIQFMGFANTADSLYAVSKAVFEDGRFTPGELADMLAEDWMDAEEARVYLLRRVAKYGNDDDEVDAMAVRVLDHFCDRVAEMEHFRGGRFWPGVFSVGFHVAMGAFTAATPDGRFSGDVLGNGLTPTNGNAAEPTAIMRSITKLPLHRLFNGANLNMRFHAARVMPETLVDLVRTYFEAGGFQVQFNMIDGEVLREAQERPEEFGDLVVRVSGYSALFTLLSDTAQDEIISRTEFDL
ncbi:MAG: glycyl radical protein [Actinobacteria bacterium]|nr:glycyl radical protein [Actinomycetota bacterium]MBU1944913.1 glycyl radical protein [Actinomycetota bacterium]MBU2688117.1 glycyl radical protein [Actinomycetota bacterium]